MRVLILSSINGGGHTASARALKELFEAHGAVCDIEDCLSFISENISQTIAKSHSFVYRHVPRMFDYGYRQAEKHSETLMEHHNGRRMLRLGCRNLARFIKARNYDTVVCTHVFAALMVTDVRRKYGFNLRTGVVETDYTVTPGAQAGELDWHFVPAKSLVEPLAQLGVNREKIIPSGIPVRADFLKKADIAEIRRDAGLPEDCLHLLVMGGSMGAGPVPELVAELLREMDDRTRLSIICGTNKTLMKELKELYSAETRLKIYGFSENIAHLMASADLLLTKPGGITVTEAMISRLPMVLMNTVAGCESYNLDFFVGIGGACTADTPQALVKLCLDCLHDESRRAAMAQALDGVAREHDQEVIWQKIKGVC